MSRLSTIVPTYQITWLWKLTDHDIKQALEFTRDNKSKIAKVAICEYGISGRLVVSISNLYIHYCKVDWSNYPLEENVELR